MEGPKLSVKPRVFLTCLGSVHHEVLRRLVDRMMVQVGVQHSNKCNFLHLIVADISVINKRKPSLILKISFVINQSFAPMLCSIL